MDKVEYESDLCWHCCGKQENHTKMADRKRERQGDSETKRQGDKERKVSLSPLLLVSLSTNPLCPYFPTPATASELLQVKVVKANENARTFPPSNAATSLTVKVHVPFPFCPLNAASGLAGLNEPVNGAPAGEMPWINAVALSSSTVLQKLLPLFKGPPAWFISVTVVPCGEVSVITRSPTQVWSRPTVVEPMSAVQPLPSKLNLRPPIGLERPLTSIGTVTVEGILGSINTGGPV